ncbi:uncharacterized protein PRCAT00001511001 [Priceomyces carsonii]|uniref:uncharacterized protein n=1 Tax=Priceomyces carsonii TaxID=28549 RepID=UPI002ED88C48|nr:unnamed protein product [Priceomyces carsonii]
MIQKSTAVGGDDLDDGLEYEIQYSDGETEQPKVFSEDEDKITPLENDQKVEVLENEGKRKRNKQKPSSLQNKKKQKMEIDVEKKRTLSKESSTDLIADEINSKIRRREPDLSALELSERYFSKSDFRSTSDFIEEPRNLDNLAKFINLRFKNMLVPDKKKKKKSNEKRPDSEKVVIESDLNERRFITILSMSAIRVCDTYRVTRELTGSSIKLINKNKLSSDLSILKDTKARILCSTPGRLSKVLNSENLTLKGNEIKIIIVDSTYLDKKCQNVWDLKETADVLKNLTKGGSKIYLY